MLLDGLDYQDSAQKRKEIKSQYHSAVLMKTDVGGTVFFGTYEQDNNASNGKEDVEWLVLEKKDNRLLVVSQYGLDSQTYNTGKKEPHGKPAHFGNGSITTSLIQLFLTMKKQ